MKTTILIFQMKKLSCKEIKNFDQGQIASKGRARLGTQTIQLH